MNYINEFPFVINYSFIQSVIIIIKDTLRFMYYSFKPRLVYNFIFKLKYIISDKSLKIILVIFCVFLRDIAHNKIIL